MTGLTPKDSGTAAGINWLEEALALQDRIVSWRRDLHRIPELDLRLPHTKQYVEDVLRSLGIPYETYERHDGITALIGRPGGRVAAVRGDMDALPLWEETGLPFASDNGCMHACGHDGHTAILLGLAAMLKKYEDRLPGQVKLIFQPGEENLIGAKELVADGVLENPKVGRFFALHIGSLGGRGQTGDVLVNRENVFLASECVQIRVRGKGGHAASPHLTVDPVVIAAEIITAAQTLVSRELKPGTVALVAVPALETPTLTYNIIPDTITLYVGIRAKESETQEFLFRRAEALAQGIAAAHGGSAQFIRISGAPAVVNDEAAVEDFLVSAEKLLGRERIHVIDTVNMGADDAAYYMEKVPGCYIYMCNIAPHSDGEIYPHHNARFNIDESVLYEGAALLAQAAVDYLSCGETEGERQ